MRRALVLAILVMSSSVAAASPFPRGVTRLAIGHGGAASADGKLFAYWSDDGRLAIRDVAKRKILRYVLPRGAGYGRIQFSPDGARLAYVRDGWLAVADVATGTETEIARSTNQFSFDRANVLHWIVGHELRREGADRPIALPREREPRDAGGGWKPVVHVLNRFVPTASAFVVVSCGSPRAGAGCDTLWVTDVRTGRRRELARGGSIHDLVIAPSQDRICYFDARGLTCVATDGGGATTPIASGADVMRGWGHVGDDWPIPFSPDGRRLVYRRQAGKATTLVVRELATGAETRTIVPATYLDVAFWTADTLLLYEGQGRGRRAALATVSPGGKLVPLITDDTEYTVLVFVPGRRDVLYSGRENGPGRDLVEIRVQRSRIAGRRAQ